MSVGTDSLSSQILTAILKWVSVAEPIRIASTKALSRTSSKRLRSQLPRVHGASRRHVPN